VQKKNRLSEVLIRGIHDCLNVCLRSNLILSQVDPFRIIDLVYVSSVFNIIRPENRSFPPKLSQRTSKCCVRSVHAALCPFHPLRLDTPPRRYVVTVHVRQRLIALHSPGSLRIPVGARFSAPVQTGPGAHPPPCTMGNRSLSVVKWPGRDVDRSPPPRAEVKEGIELPVSAFMGELYLYFTSNFTRLSSRCDQHPVIGHPE
jgi:hypothetical protein